MNIKRQQFCREYIIDLNGTQAAIRAGYAPRSAQVTASRLLSDDMVKAEIADLMAERAERTEITADRVLQELALIGFADMATYVRMQDGTPTVDLANLPPDATKVISEITQDSVIGNDGEETVLKTKLKLCDKRAALVDIGRHLGMFTDNLNVKGDVHWVISDETMNVDQWAETYGDSVATPAGASKSTH